MLFLENVDQTNDQQGARTSKETGVMRKVLVAQVFKGTLSKPANKEKGKSHQAHNTDDYILTHRITS